MLEAEIDGKIVPIQAESFTAIHHQHTDEVSFEMMDQAVQIRTKREAAFTDRVLIGLRGITGFLREEGRLTLGKYVAENADAGTVSYELLPCLSEQQLTDVYERHSVVQAQGD